MKTLQTSYYVSIVHKRIILCEKTSDVPPVKRSVEHPPMQPFSQSRDPEFKAWLWHVCTWGPKHHPSHFQMEKWPVACKQSICNYSVFELLFCSTALDISVTAILYCLILDCYRKNPDGCLNPSEMLS